MSAAPILALLWWLVPSVALAQPPCPDDVHAWVADLADNVGTPVVAAQCRPAMVRLRLSPPGVPPMDVEVADLPVPAFRRAGQLRVSPIVDVPDFGALPQAQRRSFEAVVTWLTKHEGEVVFSDGARASVHPGVAWVGWWLLGAGLALAAIALWPLRRTPLLAWRHLGGLFLSAAALRATFGLWGPHHINGQGPLWVRGATEAGHLSAYGPGFAEVFGPVVRLWAFALEPDTALYAANLLVSSLVPVLVFAVGRSAGLGRVRAMVAALFVVLDPVSVRVAASESYFPILAALSLTVAWLLLLCLRQRSRRGAALLLVAAALLAAVAARIHPVGWILLALTPLTTLAGHLPKTRWLTRLAFAAVAAMALGAAVYLTSGRVVFPVLAHTAGPHAGHLGLHFQALPLLVTALGVALALVTPRRRRALIVAAAAFALGLAVTRSAYGQSELWQASYGRLFAPMIALGLGAALPGRLLRRATLAVGSARIRVRWSWLAPAIAAACVVGWSGDVLRERTTEQLEYRFVRARLAEIDEPCRVAYRLRAGRRVVDLPDYALPQGRGLPVESAADVAAHLTPGACVLFVESSICATSGGRPRCAAIMDRLSLQPLARATVPPSASYDELGYDRDPVPVAIYRVIGVNSSQP